MSDKLSTDIIKENPTAKYRRETFIYSNDRALSSIKTRFSANKAILCEFALLDPEQFCKIINSNGLPDDAFHNVASNYGLSALHLREEYMSFIRTYENTKEERPPLAEMEGKNKDLARENSITSLRFIKEYEIQSALPNVHTLYRILVRLN